MERKDIITALWIVFEHKALHVAKQVLNAYLGQRLWQRGEEVCDQAMPFRGYYLPIGQRIHANLHSGLIEHKYG